METIVIFSISETGHCLEYISNIIRLCPSFCQHRFVFTVPYQMEGLIKRFEVNIPNNAVFDFISSEEQKKYRVPSIIQQSYYSVKVLNKRIKRYKASKVFSLFLSPMVPFATVFISRRVKVSGIVYQIFLYEEGASWKRRLRQYLSYKQLSHCYPYDKVYILNAEKAVYTLNTKYRTNRFVCLVDPYTPISNELGINFRKEFDIPDNTTLFAHFGGLTRRKGTLSILKSIKDLTVEEKKNYYFAFAGVVGSDIKREFYEMYKTLSKDAHIIVKDEFCSYDYLASLCESADALLLPYQERAQSSGLLGYASQYGIPVFAPASGLIGEIVESFKLGYRTDDFSSAEFRKFYSLVHNKSIERPGLDYCNNNTIDRFLNEISKSF